MYAHFDGVVAEKLADSIVLDVNGVGYLLLVSAQTLSMAPSAGGRMKLYATLSVREDAMELFGFASRQERAMFKKLCQVTGVGAKTALGVLSALPVRELSVAIVTGDIAALSRAPGIGKKTAQRIVLELKDKVEQQDVSAPAGSAAPVSPVVGDAQREAQAALQALGYTSAEAARAINLVRDQADTVDALIMLALRQIGSL